MARRPRRKMPWQAKPFFGGKKPKGFHVPQGGGDGLVVPEGAKAFIGFAAANRGAWTEDDGEIELATVLGEDVNVESGEGSQTSYNSGGLVADGLIQQGSMAFLGRIKDYLLAGSTVVIKTKDNGVNTWSFGLMSATGETGVFFAANSPEGTAKINNFAGADIAVTGTPLDFSGEGSENAVAMTLTPTRMELAANNSAVASGVLTEDDWPTEGADALVGAWYENSSEDEVLVSVAIYDALPSTAGLQALANF